MAITHAYGSVGWSEDIFKKYLSVISAERVSVTEDLVAHGYIIYFEDSHIGLTLGKEVLYRCVNDIEKIKEVAKAQVRRRDEYLMDLGRQVIREKEKLAKDPLRDRNYNDRPERRKK